MLRRTLATALAFAGAAYAPNAHAVPGDASASAASATPEGTESSDRISYPASFFARFSPQTAYDMVAQTPGFAISDPNNSSDQQRRGFSGAVGNVLVDGERPIAKSQPLESILERIPANQVVRIEVLRGAAVAGDASGQSTLLNVVRTPTGGSGVWSAGTEYNVDHPAPRGDASWSGRAGQTEYGFGGSLFTQQRSLPGYRLLYDAGGQQTGWIDTPDERNFREATLSGNLAQPILGGRFSSTGQFDIWRWHDDDRFNFYDMTGARTENFLNNYTERQWSIEVGANYDRDFGPWSMSLVSLINRRHYSNDEIDHDNDGAGALMSAINQQQHRNSGETILRGSLTRDFGAAHHFEFGIEGADNTLDAKLRLTEDDGAGPAIVSVPNSNVQVEETRSEAFASYTWRPTDRWAVEAKLARESSTLTFTGDSNQSVALAYIKPSLQVTRNVGAHNQFRIHVYRDVGQLNFDDFVSAAAIVDGLIAGGNPDLKPETAWRLELGADLRFPGDTAVNLAFTHHWISNTADVVQVIAPGANPGDPPVRFDAPGNIGSAEANSLVAHLSLPFNWLLKGSRLTIDNTFWYETVTDPVTGQHRNASNKPHVNLNMEFRQDISARHFAWGVDMQVISENQVYRFNEIDTQQEGPWTDLFVESTAIHGLKIRATAANIGRGDVLRQRFFFTPDRAGALDHFEIRQREFSQSPWLVVSVSGTF
ncbi:MAG: TonB-dependent receptor [Pseudomonadota bacterium]